jgi:hypothetical protein
MAASSWYGYFARCSWLCPGCYRCEERSHTASDPHLPLKSKFSVDCWPFLALNISSSGIWKPRQSTPLYLFQGLHANHSFAGALTLPSNGKFICIPIKLCPLWSAISHPPCTTTHRRLALVSYPSLIMCSICLKWELGTRNVMSKYGNLSKILVVPHNVKRSIQRFAALTSLLARVFKHSAGSGMYLLVVSSIYCWFLIDAIPLLWSHRVSPTAQLKIYFGDWRMSAATIYSSDISDHTKHRQERQGHKRNHGFNWTCACYAKSWNSERRIQRATLAAACGRKALTVSQFITTYAVVTLMGHVHVTRYNMLRLPL